MAGVDWAYAIRPYVPVSLGGLMSTQSATRNTDSNRPLGAAALSTQHLLETQRAFDSVAADYDGPTGNNALIQWMRQRLWETVDATVPQGGRLLDLGCGTGLDAAHFAGEGYRVVATDWSPLMVERTRGRAQAEGLQERLTVRQVGSHQLDQLDGEQFDGIYSDLGPLNCVPDLGAVAREGARLLAP